MDEADGPTRGNSGKAGDDRGPRTLTDAENGGRPSTRRRFLEVLGVAGTIALAGCSEGGDAGTGTQTGTGTGTDRGTVGGADPTSGTAGGSTTATPTESREGTAADATATETAGSDPLAGDLAERADATFRGGLRNWGYRPGESVPETAEIEWSVPGINVGDHTAAKASCVQAPEGTLVWPGDTGEVHAFTPEGELLWVAGTDPSSYGIHGTPTIANDTVYVGAYDGALYAFDLSTGRRRWRTRLGDAIGSSPVYHEGTVYVAVEYLPPDGSVFGVDAATGGIAFESGRPTDHPHSTIAVDRQAGKLVVGANDGTCYAWEFPSLEPAWAFDTGDAIKGPIATYDGAAFFGSWDHSVYAVDLQSGDQRWAYETGNLVMSGPAVDPDRGAVYVGGHDDHLRALSAATGDQQWAFDAGGWIIGCPTITQERVLIGSYADRLFALDRFDGHEVWHVDLRGRVTPEPLVADGRVYVSERATDEVTGHAYGIGEG